MADYQYYTLVEPLFGIGYPNEGETGSPHDEGVKATQIATLISGMLTALGPGIYAGGVGSLAGGGLVVSGPLVAVVEDSLGALVVVVEEETLGAGEFATGLNYVHLQATELARSLQTGEMYVSQSATPAEGALVVCAVTKAGGALTAVDNSVRSAPAITARLPWQELRRVFGAEETLGEALAAILGSVYLGAERPDDVDTRLAALEAGGVGGGEGGGYEYWRTMPKANGDDTRIEQEIETRVAAAMAAHVAEYHAEEEPAGGTGGAGVEQWDDDSYNQSQMAMYVTHMLPDMPEQHRNAVTVVDEHYGDGSGDDTVNWIDTENSDW
jgi:hypothetical protein